MTSKITKAAEGAADQSADNAQAAGASPAPASRMDSAAGAIIEPEIKGGVDTSHPAIDDNPRDDTSATQNARDMNDPRRRKPNDRDFAGQGIDPTPYGKKAEPKKGKAKKK